MAQAIYNEMIGKKSEEFLKKSEEGKELPKGWRVERLIDICNVKYWKNLPRKKLIDNGKYPVYWASKVIGRYNEYNVKDRTIIVWCRGTVWEINITEPYSFVTNNSFIFDFKPEEKRFFYFQLKKRGFRDTIWWVAQPQITLSSLEIVKVLVPSKDFLLKFHNIIDPFMQKMFNLQLQNQNLKQARDLLIPRLVTGKLNVEDLKIV